MKLAYVFVAVRGVAGTIDPGGVVLVESAAECPPLTFEGLKEYKVKIYGKTKLSFFASH